MRARPPPKQPLFDVEGARTTTIYRSLYVYTDETRSGGDSMGKTRFGMTMSLDGFVADEMGYPSVVP